MAPTEVRVARPERRWDCRRGTPSHYLVKLEMLSVQLYNI